MDKYLDTRVLSYLVRPQYPTSCSISSITSAFRYLFEKEFIQEDFADLLGKNIKDKDLNPGNRDIKDWSEIISNKLKVKIAVTVHFKDGWGARGEANDSNWELLKDLVRNKNNFLIMHLERHYAPILGYASFPHKPKSTASHGNRWVFIADPSPYNKQSKIHHHHLSLSPPLWSLRWEVIRKQFRRKSNYGILCLSNTRNSFS
jgi:hypothetical protein